MSPRAARTLWTVWAVALLGLVAVAGPLLVAQVTGQPAAPPTAGQLPVPAPALHTSSSEGFASIVWAFFSSSALEWIKRHQGITAFTEQTTKFAQRSVGVLLSAATALGIHMSFEATTGVLTISGLLLPSLWQLGTESIRQFAIQEMTYRMAIKPYGK